MSLFAKLFDTAGGQILATTECVANGDYGPSFRVRGECRDGIATEITFGPWPDDDAGWAHVDDLLASFDQHQADQWAERFGHLLDGYGAAEE